MLGMSHLCHSTGFFCDPVEAPNFFWIPQFLSIQLQWISHREFIERKSPTKESQDYPLVNIPVVPHKAVAEVSKIGNL